MEACVCGRQRGVRLWRCPTHIGLSGQLLDGGAVVAQLVGALGRHAPQLIALDGQLGSEALDVGDGGSEALHFGLRGLPCAIDGPQRDLTLGQGGQGCLVPRDQIHHICIPLFQGSAGFGERSGGGGDLVAQCGRLLLRQAGGLCHRVQLLLV